MKPLKSQVMSNIEGFSRKLTQEEVDEIVVELLANEVTINDISDEFGVSVSYIYNINCGKRFKIEGFKYPIRKMESPKRREDPEILEYYPLMFPEGSVKQIISN